MPAPIRIMHFVDGLGKGGLENGLVNLIERLDPERFEHVVCAIRHLGPNADRLPRDRVRVMCLERKATESALHLGALVRAIREAQPDIVHGRNWGAVEAVLAGRWAGCRAVVHSEHGLEADANAREPWRRRVFRRFAFELAHRVVSVSYQLRDLHARRTGFAAQRISVIHNGVDGRRFHPDAEARVQARRELGISADEFCIGSVGNLLPVKDHMTLLKAFDRIARNFSGLPPGAVRGGLRAPQAGSVRRCSSGVAEARDRSWGRAIGLAEMLNALDVYVLPSDQRRDFQLAVGGDGDRTPRGRDGDGRESGSDCRRRIRAAVSGGRRRAAREHLAGAAVRKRICAFNWDNERLRRVSENFSIDSMVRNYAQMYESLVSVVPAPVRAVAGA